MSKTPSADSSAVQTFATQPLDELGQGLVLAARPTGKTMVEVATFVIDAHYLGIRKISLTEMPVAALLNKVLPALHAQQAVAPIAPEMARGIVEGAVAYAKKLGFAAPGNFPEGLAVFGGTMAEEPLFSFGKNGKPFYAQQPGDDEDFVETVLAKLGKACGENGFGQELLDLEEDWLDGEDTDEPFAEEE